MKNGFRIIDSDLHVLEPGEVWDRYLDEQYRDRAPKFMGSAKTTNRNWWMVGDQAVPPWAMAEDVLGPQHFLASRNAEIYEPLTARGYDAQCALEAMDIEGIDLAIMFRTFAHMIVSIDHLDAGLATALCRAFNNWLADYCRADPARLKPAAALSLHDPEMAAEEARRAVEEKGHIAVVLLPMPVAGRYLNAPECDVLWSTAQRLGVPVAFHGTSGAVTQDFVANRFAGHPNFRTLNHAASFPLELMLALASMTAGGVLERFPNLKVAFLEGNCAWLPWWLHRLDDQWKKYGGGEPVHLSALPSEYFKRQCFIGTDVDEDLLPSVIEDIGDDNIVVSTDYPHVDGAYPHAVETFLALGGVSDASKRKILWDNCARLYNLEASVAVG
jgi:predicted TIM-barrel fold metal-dependent hydrolase